jgi:glycosyltransferase involved in cell wall biosynthesis
MSSDNAFPILHLSRNGPVYGLGRQLLYLLRGLDRVRFPPSVAVDRAGPLQDELRADDIGCAVRRMLPWRSLLYAIPRYVDALSLLMLARAHRARLVHAQDVWRAEYAYFIARWLGIPCVVHVRGPLAPRDIVKHRLHRADAIIVIARRYVDDLAAAGIAPDRIVLIDDAVDLDMFSAAKYPPRREGAFSGDPIVRVGLVGRISPEKRVREFLEIFAALPPDVRSSARFEIVGDGVDADYGRAVQADVKRLRLHRAVHFTGRTEIDNMPGQLAGLDIVVTLAGGSVMFEAMAMGTPVLSIRDDGRHSDHTRHNETAWCVSTNRPEPAVEALSLLIGDAQLRARLGAAGRAWIGTYLSVSRMVAMTEDLYDRLLTGASASGLGARGDFASAERAAP